MKTTFKVLAALFSLGMVILVGLHLFLQYGLTKAMRDVVLPRVQEETGVEVRVGRLSLNVPSGILYLKNLEVRNPAGFLLENLASIDRINVEVDFLSLLKQKLIRVKNVEIENALVNVIRNQDGELNINRFQEDLSQPAESRPIPETRHPLPETVPAPSGSASVVVESKSFPEVLRQLKELVK